MGCIPSDNDQYHDSDVNLHRQRRSKSVPNEMINHKKLYFQSSIPALSLPVSRPNELKKVTAINITPRSYEIEHYKEGKSTPPLSYISNKSTKDYEKHAANHTDSSSIDCELMIYKDYFDRIISGFFRDEKISIPTELNQMVTSYITPLEFEYFSHCGPNLRIENETKLIALNGKKANSAFGAMSILSTDECIYKWYIDIIHQNSMLTIGICSGFNDPSNAFHNDTMSINYALNCFSGSKVSKNKYKKYSNPIQSGQLCMTLDLHNGHLLYTHNEKQLGAAYYVQKSEDVRYKFCCAMRGQSANAVDISKNNLTLVRFEKWILSNNNLLNSSH